VSRVLHYFVHSAVLPHVRVGSISHFMPMNPSAISSLTPPKADGDPDRSWSRRTFRVRRMLVKPAACHYVDAFDMLFRDPESIVPSVRRVKLHPARHMNQNPPYAFPSVLLAAFSAFSCLALSIISSIIKRPLKLSGVLGNGGGDPSAMATSSSIPSTLRLDSLTELA